MKKGIAIDFIFILLITSFYWMPLLETKFFTDYQVYEKDAMATKESFLNHAIGFKSLFITPNNAAFVFEIGLPILLMLAFSVMTVRKLEENKKEYVFFLVLGIISTLMVTKYFPWKWLPNACYIIQFPWRMLVYSSFSFSIITAINMTTVIKKFNLKDVFVLSIICVMYVCSKHSMIAYSDIVPQTEQYKTPTISGQNNEWLPGMGRLEYLPTKAYENTFYIATREPEIVVLEGNAEIQEQSLKGAYASAKITTQEEKAKLELPYIYYPGYTVRFDGMLIGTFETENGFLGCWMESKESGKLEIRYTETKIMNGTKIVSAIAFLIYLIYVWKKH